MKLLFDQNLSDRLVVLLSDIFPNSSHVKKAGLARADDSEIWDYAKQNGYSIVSKDSDFHQLSFVFGSPPKVIWINIGNCSTKEIENKIRSYKKEITSFINNPQSSFLELS